jgi:1-deoxy-D-xylulose-5-phosphate reductoisomerase
VNPTSPKSIVILGSTGSIGRQALEIARALPDRIKIVGLAAGSNAELFAEQVAEFRPSIAALADENAAERANQILDGSGLKINSGAEAIEEVATWPYADLVLGAMLGAAGLQPTLAAIEAGKQIAIANKETLVAAGAIVTAAARIHGVQLLPVDSEHSAIAQCLLGESTFAAQKLTLTASGGPFVDLTRDELAKVTRAQALRHPNWSMGDKITIDSATLMNKGLEIIEARWLFDIPMEKIEVLVHRQSIVHSMVTFADNSVKAQLGVPDMRLPIQWALHYPERVAGIAPSLDLTKTAPLTFETPRDDCFPALSLARHAMQLGGTAPAVLSAANEVAVAAFLGNRCGFYGITETVEKVLELHQSVARPTLSDVLNADQEARTRAQEVLFTKL